MNKELPYFQFMVGDWFKGDIQCCKHETKGVFIDICAQLWRKDGMLPPDHDTLARLCRCDKQCLSNALAELDHWGITSRNDDGMIVVDFITEQLSEMAEKHERRVQAGRKGGMVSTLRKSSNAKAKPKQCLSNAQAFSDTESDTESDIYPDDFASFWEVYPKKKNKGAALKAWKKQKRIMPNLDRVKEVVLALSRSKDWTKESGQYIPNASTWLNANGWDDEIDTSKNGQSINEPRDKDGHFPY